MPDQAAQGSTAGYCSRWPGEPHAMSTHMRNGIAVRRCDSCGWIDFADLDGQMRAKAHEAYERGLREAKAPLVAALRGFAVPTADTAPLEGLQLLIARARDLESREATEGWEREIEYALRSEREDGTSWYSEPYYRRDLAETHRDVPEIVVQRVILARPWEPAEQPGHRREDVELTQTRAAGLIFRCHRCDITRANLDHATMRQLIDEHAPEPAEQPEPAPRCRATYEREGGRQPGDRIVECHLQAGHPGEHEEDGTDVTWLPDEPAHGGTVATQEPAVHAGDGCTLTIPAPMDATTAAEIRARFGTPERPVRIHVQRREHAALNERGHLRGCGCEDCERDDRG